MRTSIFTWALGLLALTGSSAAMATTVWITPSAGSLGYPGVYFAGEKFTLTITADVPNTFAATMALSFDAAKVALVDSNTSIAGVQQCTALAPFNVCTKNSPITANPTVFDVEAPLATAANPGIYNVAVLTFQAVVGITPPATPGYTLPLVAGNIVISDDGGYSSGWYDADTAEYIPVQYAVTPIPANLLLFGSALGVMGWMRRQVLTTI